jgi:hypothetical protein
VWLRGSSPLEISAFMSQIARRPHRQSPNRVLRRNRVPESGAHAVPKFGGRSAVECRAFAILAQIVGVERNAVMQGGRMEPSWPKRTYLTGSQKSFLNAGSARKLQSSFSRNKLYVRIGPTGAASSDWARTDDTARKHAITQTEPARMEPYFPAASEEWISAIYPPGNCTTAAMRCSEV